MAAVYLDFDGVAVHRVIKARPTATALEFRIGRKQVGLARRAPVHTVIMTIDVLAGPGTLGAGLAQHVILLWRQNVSPLFFGFLDFWHAPIVAPVLGKRCKNSRNNSLHSSDAATGSEAT